MTSVESSEGQLASPDPLKEVKKEAAKIIGLGSERNLQVYITISGALHEGIPSIDLLGEIERSDILSLELPSNVVRAFVQGTETRIDDNPFWGTSIENSNSAVGVNNNRGAVNGIRILDDRVREGQTIPQNVPDVAIGAANIKYGKGKDLERVEISESTLIENLRKQQEGFDDIFPAKTMVMQDGKEYYIHINRPVENEASALLITGGYMLPTQYMMERGEDIFGEETGGITGIELCQFALSHLIRMQVDKVQVEGMLKDLRKKMSKYETGSNIRLVHLGGAAHNPNILGILDEVFGEQEEVRINELHDERMPEPALDKLTFFGRFIPARDALECASVVEDQVVVDVGKTDALLQKLASEHADKLLDFAKREKLARDFEDTLPECDNSGQVEYFAVRSLLSLVTPDEVEGSALPDTSYPSMLAEYIIEKYPDKKDRVEKVTAQYNDRRFNFPPRRQ